MLTGQLIDDIIAREGGWKFTNDPVDRGGMTYAGVTYNTHRRWCERSEKAPLTPEQFEAQAKAGDLDGDVRAIYTDEFVTPWDWLGFPGLQLSVVDAGVMSGQSNATKMLQRALGVSVDGIAGSTTKRACDSASATPQGRNALLLHFARERAKFYVGICERNGSQFRFINGWLNRTFHVLEQSLA